MIASRLKLKLLNVMHYARVPGQYAFLIGVRDLRLATIEVKRVDIHVVETAAGLQHAEVTFLKFPGCFDVQQCAAEEADVIRKIYDLLRCQLTSATGVCQSGG